jgi:hypothetical protein
MKKKILSPNGRYIILPAMLIGKNVASALRAETKYNLKNKSDSHWIFGYGTKHAFKAIEPGIEFLFFDVLGVLSIIV